MATKHLNADASGSEYSVWIDTAGSNTSVMMSNVAINLRYIELNNSSGGTVYFKAAENADSVCGTTTPEYVLRIPNGTLTRVVVPGGQAMTAYSYWVVQGSADNNTSAPGGAVTVKIIFA